MDSAEPRVLTVIDAPPFDRAYRNPVYDAELQAIDEVGGAQPSFSLVNIRERAEGSTSETESTETVLLDR
jgi:hypothetical protein